MPQDFKPKSVLEIGCGSGAWAIAYASGHPEAQITATDVTPPNLSSPPKNLTIMADNAEQDWSFDDQFDYIHVRLLTMAIRDWPAFFRRCWEHLNPGGWVELADASTPYRAENQAANCENSVFLRVGFLYFQGLLRHGIDLMAAHHHTDRLKLQGFVNTHQEVAKWPTNGKWQSEERLKTMGDMICKNWSNISRTITPKIFKATLQMDDEKANDLVKVMLDEVENDTEKRLFFPMWVLKTAEFLQRVSPHRQLAHQV